MMKYTLKHLSSGGDLNYAELETLLHRVANVINDRTLGVRHHGGAEGELVPITPNTLLLSRTDSGGHWLTRY